MRLFYLLLIFLMAVPAWSQEEDVSESAVQSAVEDEAESAESEGAAEDAEDEEIDDSDLDSQTYEDPEDVFIPTEEIPSDEPIPFPSNI
jgi:hypothetical protein